MNFNGKMILGYCQLRQDNRFIIQSGKKQLVFYQYNDTRGWMATLLRIDAELKFHKLNVELTSQPILLLETSIIQQVKPFLPWHEHRAEPLFVILNQ